MKVKELTEILNKHIKEVDFSKIHTHDEFHQLVESSIVSFLPIDLIFVCWGIRHKKFDNSEDKIITYNRVFEEYKNSRYKSKGKFSNIRFISESEIADLEIPDIINYFSKKHTEEQIKDIEKSIKEYTKSLKECQKRLKELKGDK